jgi:hypothetical protein
MNLVNLFGYETLAEEPYGPPRLGLLAGGSDNEVTLRGPDIFPCVFPAKQGKK